MKTNLSNSLIFLLAIAAGCGLYSIGSVESRNSQLSSTEQPVVRSEAWAQVEGDVIVDPNIQLCQGFGYVSNGNQCGCQGQCNGSCGAGMAPMVMGGPIQEGFPIEQAGYQGSGFGYGQPKMLLGVDDETRRRRGAESRFRNGSLVPFDQHSYGGYVAPHRTPSVPEYRLQLGDLMEFVFLRTREKSLYPYQLFVGDVIEVSSSSDASLNQTNLVLRSDGMTTFAMIGQVSCAGKTIEDLQRELNEKYGEFVREPAVVVQVRQGETPLQDIFDSVDARQGQGGQSRQSLVAADGTIALPGIGNVPALGLSLNEVAREVNARYRLRLGGIEVTPVLLQRAPQFVYVVGEAAQPGRYEMTGPTTALQAVALAQGFNEGGNIRQIIVIRRDQNWKLTATKLDLAGALYGKRPQPSDEIWLQKDDIIIIPKKPIQRFSEAVNQYLSNTLYQIFPQQGVAFNFDDFTSL